MVVINILNHRNNVLVSKNSDTVSGISNIINNDSRFLDGDMVFLKIIHKGKMIVEKTLKVVKTTELKEVVN